MKKPLLQVKKLAVSINKKPIIAELDLDVESGEIHALMGPNGAGKSTFSAVLMGSPKYTVEKGKIYVSGKEISKFTPDERAKRGLFLAFQYPVSVPGVSVESFLRRAAGALTGKTLPPAIFRKELFVAMKQLGMNESFAKRSLNDGFSGGEKKRTEMLQMIMLKPKIAILDECDSGLDIDGLKMVAKAVNTLVKSGTAVIMITHYQRILDFIKPDKVHVFAHGKIIQSGTAALAKKIEKNGYVGLLKEHLKTIPSHRHGGALSIKSRSDTF